MNAFVDINPARIARRLCRPLFASTVQAGFPSPADDYIDRSLDLSEHLIKHPAATFFMRVAGNSMTGAGIFNGDLLIVDRALEPRDGNIIVAVLDGEITVKRLRKREGRVTLEPDNPDFPSLLVPEESEFEVWGVVRHVVHTV